MKFQLGKILKKCCQFCDSYDSKNKQCGSLGPTTSSKIKDPLSYSCSFCCIRKDLSSITTEIDLNI